jgi:hypothetical protein
MNDSFLHLGSAMLQCHAAVPCCRAMLEQDRRCLLVLPVSAAAHVIEGRRTIVEVLHACSTCHKDTHHIP